MTYLCVPLWKRRKIAAWSYINVEDVKLTEYKWQFKDGYAKRTGYLRGKGKIDVMLHREILGLKYGDKMQGDHKDLDRLNNKRSNLRVVTHAQNRQNRRAVPGSHSQYRGVQRYGKYKWKAVLRTKQKYYEVVNLTTEEEAARIASDLRKKHLPYSEERKI